MSACFQHDLYVLPEVTNDGLLLSVTLGFRAFLRRLYFVFRRFVVSSHDFVSNIPQMENTTI